MPISFSFVFIRLVVLVFFSAYALFRHRRGRKTGTSSDASQESQLASQASIRRFPCPQGRRSRGDRPTVRSRGTRDPTAAREICLPRQFEIVLRFVLAEIVYQKIRPACEKICGILRRLLTSTEGLAKSVQKMRAPFFAHLLYFCRSVRKYEPGKIAHS